jgi:hypothetical protein
MRVSVPENFQNSAVGRFLFLENFFQRWIFSGGEGVSMDFERLDRLSLHGARGGAPQAPQHPSPGKARARREFRERPAKELKADKDRKLIIEHHFARRKSLL